MTKSEKAIAVLSRPVRYFDHIGIYAEGVVDLGLHIFIRHLSTWLCDLQSHIIPQCNRPLRDIRLSL